MSLEYDPKCSNPKPNPELGALSNMNYTAMDEAPKDTAVRKCLEVRTLAREFFIDNLLVRMMGRELMAPVTDRTTLISSGVASPVATNHAAKGSVFVKFRNAGNLENWPHNTAVRKCLEVRTPRAKSGTGSA